MKKGVLGISTKFYAVLAFVLIAFNQTLLCGILLGFVLLVEKDEWISRQCMQAFFLSFIYMISSVISNLISYIISFFDSMLDSDAYSTIYLVSDIIDFILWVLVLVFALIGLFAVMKGKEANIPIFSKFADKAYGIFRAPPPAYNQGYPAQYPQGQQPYAPNYQNQGYPAQNAPQQPQPQGQQYTAEQQNTQQAPPATQVPPQYQPPTNNTGN